jgi:putative ABC transport system permease protein
VSLWKIAWRSIQQRALSSGLTAFSISLGVALVVAVLVIHSTIDRAFRRGAQGYDLIVGAKGGPLPLVLNTVFYLKLNQQLDTVPYELYERLTSGPMADGVELAIPVCLGHEYKNCPVVATTQDMFGRLKYGDDQSYRFAEGENFNDGEPFEAVVGSIAATKADLKVGSQFQPMATTRERTEPGKEGHEPFTIVGILAPTGTPNDRAIFINMEGFFRCPAHKPAVEPERSPGKEPAKADAEHDHGHEQEHPLSAVLVCTDKEKPLAGMRVHDEINRNKDPRLQSMAVFPTQVIADLFEQIVGNVQLLLLVLAVLVVVVAGIGILVSIYNSMNDRRHEIAVMRALGASRAIVMSVILLEAILLALGGGLAGLVLGHGLTGLLSPMIAKEIGVMVGALEFQTVELLLVPGLIVLATVVGYLPAVVAYRTDVAKSLQAGT